MTHQDSRNGCVDVVGATNNGGRTIRNTATIDSRQEEQNMKPLQQASVKTLDGTSSPRESAFVLTAAASTTNEREETSTSTLIAKDDPQDMNTTHNDLQPQQQHHDVPHPKHDDGNDHHNDDNNDDEQPEQQQDTKDVGDTTLCAIRRGDLDALKKSWKGQRQRLVML